MVGENSYRVNKYICFCFLFLKQRNLEIPIVEGKKESISEIEVDNFFQDFIISFSFPIKRHLAVDILGIKT